MVTALTPVRVARVSRAAFQQTEESSEVDFQLAHRQGVLIHAVEFGMGSATYVPASDNDQDYAYLSLHAETGELENAADQFGDSLVLNSEIIAEAVLWVSGATTAGEETGIKKGWLTPIAWNYNELLGDPLLLATNLTFRGITTNSVLTVGGAFARIFYQYVELSQAELANQFILRR